ncbi:MAG: hypothetical protein JWN10_1177 [Solirubrobacterales bacterium]|nr:hypothetical protein [Solirubrobacterales bacterium]
MNSGPSIRQARRTLTRPRPTPRSCVPAIALLAALMTSTISNNAQGDPRARAARALNVNDTAHLHYVKESDAQLIDEGAATGTVPGTVRVSFDVGATVAATFTIYTHGGSIVGHGSGALHTSKSRSDVYVSFGGTLTVTHGTGRYAHAHGTGGFYGTVDRKNYAATIQTTGTLSY